MPFRRPTIAELRARVATSFASRITDERGRPLGTLLPRGPLRVFANTVAGESHENFGMVADVARQAFPDTADAIYLERYAAQRGVSRKAAAPAKGLVACTGTVGAVVPAGAVLTRNDGARYLVDVDTTLSASPQDVAVTAELGGAGGNLEAGALLQFATPVPFVASSVTVVADDAGRGLSGGLDVESDARLLQRLSQVVKTPPQGGAVADYEKWTLEVPGVTRVWVRPLWMGAGSVGVTFVLDDDPTSIIPTPEKVLEVQCYLDARRPVTADVFVFAPTPLPVDVEVVLTPDTTPVRAAVELALAELLEREADLGEPLLLTHVAEAVSTAAGEVDHDLLAPLADVVALAYELPTLGVVTFS